MPVYRYKATNKDGKLEKGTISAANKHDVSGILKDRELKLLAVTEEKSGFVLFKSDSVPLSEKVSLCRYLGLIIRSGLSLSEGFLFSGYSTFSQSLKLQASLIPT